VSRWKFSAPPLRSLRLCGFIRRAPIVTAETQRTQRKRRESSSFVPINFLCLNPSLKSMHQNILELSRSALLIIDMQEAFRANISDFDRYANRIAVATRGALLLNLPILVTEQYPKGLGHTAREIREVLPSTIGIMEKTTFSSCGAHQFETQLRKETKQILVAGIEAHICVNQTVHDLLAAGFQVHLLTDCIASRKETDRTAALQKMQSSGAIASSVEMALFELMRDSRHEQFKAIQGLIK
jgi:nicotinamidase-related amidase